MSILVRDIQMGLYQPQDIVDLMNLSMLQTQSDVFGSLDFERSQNGSGSSVRVLQKKVMQL